MVKKMAKEDEMLEELRKIRELLSPPPPLPPTKNFFYEFKKIVGKNLQL